MGPSPYGKGDGLEELKSGNLSALTLSATKLPAMNIAPMIGANTASIFQKLV